MDEVVGMDSGEGGMRVEESESAGFELKEGGERMLVGVAYEEEGEQEG